MVGVGEFCLVVWREGERKREREREKGERKQSVTEIEKEIEEGKKG